MKRAIIALFLTCSTCFANSSAVREEPKKELPEADLSKISEAFGHLFGKNLEFFDFKLDIPKVIKGIQDSVAGKESPMTEAECMQAISLLQEKKFQEQSKENLKASEEFLKENLRQEGIVSLEEGRLQYKVEKTGSGESVQEHFSPLVRYTGRFLNGDVFGTSAEDQLISVDEAGTSFPGFAKGILGMKEGEKRTLYIHPELAYKDASGYLPPNALLTFEVEVVKANFPKKEGETLSSTFSAEEAQDPLLLNNESAH